MVNKIKNAFKRMIEAGELEKIEKCVRYNLNPYVTYSNEDLEMLHEDIDFLQSIKDFNRIPIILLLHEVKSGVIYQDVLTYLISENLNE